MHRTWDERENAMSDIGGGSRNWIALAVSKPEREILRRSNQYGCLDYVPMRRGRLLHDDVSSIAPQRLVQMEPSAATARTNLDKWVSHHIMIPENYIKHIHDRAKILC